MKAVAEFQIEYEQILSEDSQLTKNIPEQIKTEDLIEFYRLMTITRTFDKKAVSLQRTGKMGTYASTLGQEAISTAIGYAMENNDVLSPFYREYTAMYQRGVKLSDILSYWGGDERGSAYENNAQDFPICVPIASQCLHAAGAARAFQLKEEKGVAVSTIGDGGTSQGDFYEALNVGGAWNLPLVIVINNNQWAISVPLSKQTSCQTLAQKAIGAGVKGIQVDGNDMIGTYSVMKDAIEHARSGKGPVLVEALTYRLCDHTTADDATRYRPQEEVDAAWKVEPISRLEKYLLENSIITDSDVKMYEKEAKELINKEVDIYLNRDKPSIEDMFDYHYETLPDILSLQKQIALAEEGK